MELDYLTIDDIHKITHLGKESIRKHIRLGNMVGRKVGTRYLVEPREVKRFIDTIGKKKENR